MLAERGYSLCIPACAAAKFAFHKFDHPASTLELHCLGTVSSSHETLLEGRGDSLSHTNLCNSSIPTPQSQSCSSKSRLPLLGDFQQRLQLSPCPTPGFQFQLSNHTGLILLAEAFRLCWRKRDLLDKKSPPATKTSHRQCLSHVTSIAFSNPHTMCR